METHGPFPEVFIGRQPILDRDQVTIGYELLFRAGRDNAAQVTDGHAATADVVCKAFAELGLASALGAQRAFVNVDRNFLFDDAVQFLPRRLVVLEVDLTDANDAAAIARCRQLRAMGYEFSVRGLAADGDVRRPLADVASFVRIDVNTLAGDQLTAIAAELASPAWKLIAARVESAETRMLCLNAGFQLFQGYYFAKPVVLEGRKLDASTQGLMHIVNLLEQDAELAKLEQAFKREPALTVNLLRLTNSVGAGLTVKISSLRHAITVLGRNQIQRWLQLLLFGQPGGNAVIAENPLMQWAAFRGHFMELLATRCYPGKKDLGDKAFIAGLISLMPNALGIPLPTILEQIGLPQDVHQALLARAGDVGVLLEIAERYDANDVNGIMAVFPRVGSRLNFEALGQCLTDALGWVQQLAVEGS